MYRQPSAHIRTRGHCARSGFLAISTNSITQLLRVEIMRVIDDLKPTSKKLIMDLLDEAGFYVGDSGD